MLAGKVNSALRGGDMWLERQHLSRQQVGDRAPRPWIKIPYFDEATLVVLPDAGIGLFDRLQAEFKLRRFRLTSQFLRFWTPVVRNQDAARAMLAKRAIPDLHRMVGFSEAAEPVAHPVPDTGLQVDAGDALIRQRIDRRPFPWCERR